MHLFYISADRKGLLGAACRKGNRQQASQPYKPMCCHLEFGPAVSLAFTRTTRSLVLTLLRTPLEFLRD